MTTHLTNDKLFVRQPESAAGSLFFDLLYVNTAPLLELIDATYHVLAEGTLPLGDVYKVWEIRLTLLLFDSQLYVAKREAVNLNNAVYLNETPDSGPDSPNAGRLGAVMPLPKNNDGAIGYLLLLLLLRLKTVPNLGLVNEMYKVCYQTRLRGSVEQKDEVQSRLISLSYEIISILAITKNFQTLLAFLSSLRGDLRIKCQESERLRLEFEEVSSNCELVWFIAKIMLRRSASLSLDDFVTLHQKDFSEIRASSFMALTFVMKTIAPNVGGDKTAIDAIPKQFDLQSVVSLIEQDQISMRTLCCMLSVWDLTATYITELTGDSLRVTLSSGNAPIDQVFDYVMAQWGNHVNKLYGME